MRQITVKIILALLGGAFLWQGIISTTQGRPEGLVVLAVGFFLAFKSRFE